MSMNNGPASVPCVVGDPSPQKDPAVAENPIWEWRESSYVAGVCCGLPLLSELWARHCQRRVSL